MRQNNNIRNLEISLSGIIRRYDPNQSKADVFERDSERFYLCLGQSCEIELRLEEGWTPSRSPEGHKVCCGQVTPFCHSLHKKGWS